MFRDMETNHTSGSMHHYPGFAITRIPNATSLRTPIHEARTVSLCLRDLAPETARDAQIEWT